MTDNSNKRIALVANTTWNIYNFRQNIIHELISRGYAVDVYAPVDEFISYTKKYPGLRHFPLNHLKRDSINPFYELKFALELFIKYRRNPADLIIHYTSKPNIYGAIPSACLGIKSIAVVTGLGYPFLNNSIVKAFTKMLYRLTSRYHQRFIFENIDDRLLFEKEGLISKEKGMSVKGCGVDTSHFLPRETKDKSNKTIFTFIGRLLYDKGFSEFVSASKKVKSIHPNTEFWVVGEIDELNPAAVNRDLLTQWIQEKHIIYHGSTPDVRDYIAKSDCVVLPSYREAIARSLSESMSMCKAVITTDTAGCREIVEEGKNGFIVPIKDASALAKAMIKFHNLSGDSKKKLGEYGRQKAIKEFDDKIIAKQICDQVDLLL